MTEVADLSITDASNTAISGIDIAEGCDPGNLNNSDRAIAGLIARFFAVLNGSKATGGTANAQTYSAGLSWSDYDDDHPIVFRAGAGLTNTGNVTLNVDSLGAKAIKYPGGGELAPGAIRAGGIYTVIYNTTLSYFVLQGGHEPGAVKINPRTTTSETLALTDSGCIVTMSNSSANALAIPLNSSVAFPVGTSLAVQQIGSGATTIDAATGVTLNGVSGGSAQLNNRYSGVTLFKIASDTWLMAGAHATVA